MKKQNLIKKNKKLVDIAVYCSFFPDIYHPNLRTFIFWVILDSPYNSNSSAFVLLITDLYIYSLRALEIPR